MNEIKSLHDLPGGSDPAGVIAHSVLDWKPRLPAKVRGTREYRAAKWLAS